MYHTAGIWQTSNFGVNWDKLSATTQAYTAISSDSSGQYLVAVVNEGGIYYSLNNGTTWTLSSSAPLTQPWISVTSDSTGQYVVASTGCGTATACAGSIYLSSDYGQTWYQSTAATGSYDIVTSISSGKTIYTASYNSVIYVGTVAVPDSDDNSVNSNDDDSDSSSLSDGAIAGIVIGGVAFVALAGFAVYYFFFRKNGADLNSKLLP